MLPFAYSLAPLLRLNQLPCSSPVSKPLACSPAPLCLKLCSPAPPCLQPAHLLPYLLLSASQAANSFFTNLLLPCLSPASLPSRHSPACKQRFLPLPNFTSRAPDVQQVTPIRALWRQKDINQMDTPHLSGLVSSLTLFVARTSRDVGTLRIELFV